MRARPPAGDPRMVCMKWLHVEKPSSCVPDLIQARSWFTLDGYSRREPLCRDGTDDLPSEMRQLESNSLRIRATDVGYVMLLHVISGPPSSSRVEISLQKLPSAKAWNPRISLDAKCPDTRVCKAKGISTREIDGLLS